MFEITDTAFAGEGWSGRGGGRPRGDDAAAAGSSAREEALAEATAPAINALSPMAATATSVLGVDLVDAPGEPHWLLDQLAVEPAAQGRGIAGAMIRHAIAGPRPTALPLVLETARACEPACTGTTGSRCSTRVTRQTGDRTSGSCAGIRDGPGPRPAARTRPSSRRDTSPSQPAPTRPARRRGLAGDPRAAGPVARGLAAGLELGRPPRDGARFHSEVPSLRGWMAAGTVYGRRGRPARRRCQRGGGPGEAYLELDPDWRHLQAGMLDWPRRTWPCPATTARAARVSGVGLRPAAARAAPRARLRGARGGDLAAAAAVRRRRRSRRPVVRPGTRCGPRRGRRSTRTRRGWPCSSTRRSDGRSTRQRSTGRSSRVTLVPPRPQPRRRGARRVVRGPRGFTLDGANRHGIIEPVCTHPDHRQRGLAAALILEGLRRLRDLGAGTCDVETGDMVPANALYRSIGFSEEYRGHLWRADRRAG